MLISHRSIKFPKQIHLRLSLKTILRLMSAQQIRRFRSTLFLALLASVLLLLVGCKAGANKVVKGSDEAVFDQAASKTDQKKTKPEPIKSETIEGQRSAQAKEPIQIEKADKSRVAENKTGATANPSEPPVAPPPNPPKLVGSLRNKTKVGEKRNKNFEIDEVRQAALDVAKNIDTIKKIRICHHKTEDEWWVTLYDDIGPLIDLKQYVWDRDSEKLTPFLVLKRISKARFELQLISKDPDKTCEVMDPPPKPTKKKEKEDKKNKAF